MIRVMSFRIAWLFITACIGLRAGVNIVCASSLMLITAMISFQGFKVEKGLKLACDGWQRSSA